MVAEYPSRSKTAWVTGQRAAVSEPDKDALMQCSDCYAMSIFEKLRAVLLVFKWFAHCCGQSRCAGGQRHRRLLQRT